MRLARTCIFNHSRQVKNEDQIPKYQATVLGQGMNANEEVFNDFFDAVKDGHLDRVTELIANGFNIEANGSKGWTALHHASEHGHLEIVAYLFVTCHVNMEAKTNASCNGRLPVVRYIVETCHVDAEASDVEGWNALHYASENGHLEVVEYLIETCNVDAEAKDNGGWTALHQACEYGHLDIVIYLNETCHVNMESRTCNGLRAHPVHAVY